jgi:hypothetical protein
MDVIRGLTQSLCKPLLLYITFVSALILYDITQFDSRAVLKNTLFLAAGSALIYFLCNAGFEIVAWFLLALPPFFFVALLALLVITQILKTRVIDDDGSNGLSNWRNFFGFKSPEEAALEHVERDVEQALGATAEKCAQAVAEPIKKIQMWKLTPLPPVTVQSVACPSCNSVSTSS